MLDNLVLTNCARETGDRPAAELPLLLWTAITAGFQMLQLLRSMPWCGSGAQAVIQTKAERRIKAGLLVSSVQHHGAVSNLRR
jgi:hypothetical protein